MLGTHRLDTQPDKLSVDIKLVTMKKHQNQIPKTFVIYVLQIDGA